MDGKWLLLRCPCGNFFGAALGGRVSCTRCSNSNDIVTASSYPSPEKLAEAVSRSNLPKELSAEVTEKISKAESRHMRARNRESNSFESIISSMRGATGQDGIMTLGSVSESLVENGLTDVDAWELINDAEREGILHRAGEDMWGWVQ
ncbi:MAG: hypothetical protein VYA39_04070 [Candidatus Thermoplasmatota archaeon]|nr:hypothetical protein [Candidatus Thermoplasmatota archaeon]|tara:strand:+ start:28370 stop:28813 length:444 start_codon:yes stop_codon:yes gene_type:complete